MNKNEPGSLVSHFLDDVTDQISYQPLRPSIRQEMEAHIQDRMEEYEAKGIPHEDAERQALRVMGDAVSIGTELNNTHKLQKSPFLSLLSTILIVTGIAFASFMQWTPEQMGNGFLYYIPGAILLIFVSLKGYPLFIRYRKLMAVFIGLLYLVQVSGFVLAGYYGYFFVTVRVVYFAVLLFSPVFIVLLYCFRKNRNKLLTLLGCAGVWVLLIYAYGLHNSYMAVVISLLSIFGTVFFMINRGILDGKKRYLYSGALILMILLGSPLLLTAYGRLNVKIFLSPQSVVRDTWDDSYNGILIQELLSKTPMIGGLDLSSEEMMDYGTGAWYFASRDPNMIGIDASLKTGGQREEFEEKVEALREQGYFPKYIHYQADNVTLWDILPQHYHNNYLIAVCIFMFGWLPGILLTGAIALFYIGLFFRINRIHGKLSSALAFCCGQCLLWQGVFYVLGNFGFQYGTFPNLPLVSEGRISILFNMLLLGLVFSAYRYDHVSEELVPG